MQNKMIDLHNALFVELETLQDKDSYSDENGNLDPKKAKLAIERAQRVSEVAGRIMELHSLELEVAKLAEKHGIVTKLPEVLGLDKLDKVK